MDQFEHVKKIVDARRCGDAAATDSAEKNYIREFIGRHEADIDQRAERQGHQDYEGMTAMERTEALADALFEAFDGAQSVIDTQEALTRKRWHPFFLSRDDLGHLWELRKTLDDIGVPYTLFAYAALADWLIYKKLRRFPTVTDLSDEGIIVTVLDYWGHPELDHLWDEDGESQSSEVPTYH